MDLLETAEKLIEAKTEAARKSLLKDISETDFLKLAQALKNTYYKSWTNEPKKVPKTAQALKSLLKIYPTAEIEALSLWVLGIAYLTRGKLSSAIENLDKAAQIFRKINKEYESAQTQVAKLYALGLTGRYDDALECGKTALMIFEKHGDEIAAGKIENNIGNLFIRQELLFEAEKYYLSARTRFLKLKDTEQLVLSEIGLANTYSYLNDFRKAEKLFRRTLSTAEETGMFLRQAEIETNIGSSALYRGKYDEALKFLESSRQKYEQLKMPHQTTIAKLEIADAYLELNLLTEAFEIYKIIADKLHNLKMQGEEARARANFGRVAVILNDTRTARRELKKSARLYDLERNKVGAATIKLSEASLEFNLRNYEKALRLAQIAEMLFKDSEDRRHLLIARFLQAEARRKSGEHERARKMLVSIFNESIKQEQPNTAQSAQVSLGIIAAERKNFRQAERHFKLAIDLIETLRAPLAAEEFRMAFLANKLAPFENLANIYLKQNKFAEAFLTIEKARARSLAESLSDGEIQTGAAAQSDASTELTRQLEALREELNWFYSRLNRADEAEIKKLQSEAKKREKQIADVMRRIAGIAESKFGKRDFLDLARLQSQLGEQRALLEFVSFEGSLSAFVVNDQTIHFVADLGKEGEVLALLENLQFQFGSLRYGADVLDSFMPELKKRADFYLRKLNEKLIEPLESFIGSRDLTIVPVGALHYVPFHALFDGTRYQIEKREIIYAPSATVWQTLASKPERKLETALLIGFADERIPLVAREIESLKNIFAESKVLTGEQATFSAFTKNAARFDVLHLACHGQFRPENPLFSSLHLADGWITVRDICSQRLSAEIVTLSACETGLHKIFAGDEILGLARGFLTAGAKSLILSLWTVNDKATAELMTHFYKNLQLNNRASASLRAAQINFIERGAHPYFWSPFALIGR